ncbi:Mitochondrial import inner membrane translocase subunit TIM44 [Echinococcus granulosus]|uniref:Mitochondrial import inner membrane translocase subunit TIM44 n=1 Tax=Echinococcus granulosus TaxID=6210 RepID=W6V6S1_ECHGR|nr:Mitochondrial import inner membrane translocase subunit TIM44 [Echinococcus granulosus]EUB62109.1 Mitochondrial import inner membrane translocase subunit TIM44 [Echinococcus granulosus]
MFMTNWDQQDEAIKCSTDVDREDARFKLTECALRWSPKCHPAVHADAVATGHYAQNSYGNFLEDRAILSSPPKLLRSVDPVKDQTFWLCNISWRHLQHCMFPVGNLMKSRVKEIAASVGLERIAKRKESMGICFIGKRNFCDFIDKESVRKFREETEKLEKSKEVQSMREFYKKIESEIPLDAVEKVRDHLESAAKRIRTEGENWKKQEYVRKGLEGISKASEQLVDVSRSIGKTEFVKSARETLEALEKELQSDRALVYRAPDRPRTRAEITGGSTERIVDADTKSSGVVLHKDSKWVAAWENFKDTNQYVQKFFDLKARYEESDHFLARSLRFVTDKITELVGSRGSENDLQKALEEITKIDPNFTTEKFIRYCRVEVIPNVLESIIHGHLDVLKDWCYEASFNVLSAPIKQTRELGFHMDSRILDVHNIDVCMGKMMEQGPVLIITFQAQQIQCIRDTQGAVKEGDPEKVLRVTHVWALCRDQSELNPWMAWRVLDVAMMPTEQWV